MHAEKNYFALGYNPGSIIRVRVKNFLTYDECEVFPGPKLNVVIGPNGSGKSTLTHAICLACCGSTGDIGRASDLAKFVKRGKTEEEAFVEVDILEDTGTLVTLRRTINAASNTSKWQRNHHPISLAEAKKCIAHFRIDVDNLCSFMPQDKVGKFTQYSPKEVLQNTLKSIRWVPTHQRGNSSSSADPEYLIDDNEKKDLFTEQQELSDSQVLKDNLRKTRDSKLAHVDHLEKQMQGLTLELDRIKQKDRAKEMKRSCEFKLLRLNAAEIKDREKEIQEQITALVNHLKTANEQIAPQENQLRDFRKVLSKLSRDENVSLDELQEIASKISRDGLTMTEYEDTIEKSSIELVNVQTIRQNTEKELENKKEEVKKQQQRYQQAVQETALIQEEIERIQSERKELLMKEDTTQATIQTLMEEQEQSHRQLKLVTQQFSQLQDSRELFKQKLTRRAEGGSGGGGDPRLFQDTLHAMHWLETHQERLLQERRLRAPVIGPIAFEMKASNPACAAMIEQIVPMNRLLGFLVTNDADAAFLKQKFRGENRWLIDIFTMKNIQANPSKLPYSEEMLARNPIPGLGYLYKEIECSDVVRSFLFSFQSLHTVVWANVDASMITTDKLLTLCPAGVPGFRLFVHEQSSTMSNSTSRGTPSRGRGGDIGSIVEYNGRKSRYAPNAPPSTASFFVSPKGLVTCKGKGGGQDDAAIEELRASLIQQKQQLTEKLEHLDQQITSEQQQLSQFRTQSLGFKHHLQDLTKKLKLPSQLLQVIETHQQSIKQLEKRLIVDAKHQKQTKQEQYMNTIDHLLQHLEQMTTSIETFSEHRTDRRVVQTLKQMLEGRLQILEGKLEVLKRDIRDLKKTKEIYHRQLEEMTRERTELTKEMNEMIASYGGEQVFMEEIYPRILQDCQENTREAIEDRIVAIEAQIKAIIDNPEVVERHQQLETELNQYKKELELAEKELGQAETTLQERTEHWLREVNTITQKLNNLFSAYMKGLGFDGEVVLRPIGRLIDYEMQLRVSFREHSGCSDLSGSRHSGGERAVSTIMFLMALQQMTSSPFRVVDEINQGMDERNERLVFDRIVKSCCEDSRSPQYFLVTPKLLQGLRCLDHPEVTVLLIWNGPGIEEKWNLSEIVQNLKRKRGGMKSRFLAAEEDGDIEELDEDDTLNVKEETRLLPKTKYLKVK